ncbi:STAS/SEC14 domain-containing protein [Angustibacter sp. McL0619]|uniref:STAS/SEC14 domain-containing protein n=1 Tax=Angustibacter sp. McL0619 TaxID=3415676 RepID=UPI003CFB9700
MIKVIDRMPVGTIGLEATGKVTEQDYRDVLVPTLARAQGQGKVRLLYVLGDDFESYSAGAVWADAKVWAKNLDGWERIAIVADADWLEHAVKAVNWMVSGEIKMFEPDDLRDAKIWLVGIDD